MKIKKKILLGLLMCIIALNLVFTTNTKQPDIDLKQLSNMAIASGETDPGEGDPPIIEPYSLDWLLDIIGF